ncbi:hypothetical protein L1987_22921 [Smallanthus sonchifolius]|uniref:Uncharacterized protein n=1 Tax=Smallanthus sonchifolius TaxID=185202 RepID=A0ACB9IHM9_9ASTR|nr:hypothetical protein L1987_22921 [Smallanthus sonchifolius]
MHGVGESFHYHDKELETEEGFRGMSNVKRIHESNKMDKPYKLKVNEFADMTNMEFVNNYANSKISHFQALRGPGRIDEDPFANFIYQNATNLPPKVDWREKNAVTDVKGQAGCGSCWGFAAVVAVEGINAIRTGQLVKFSEQQLVDCDIGGQNKGCDGGLMELAFTYIIKNAGLATETSYPYVGKKENCDRSKIGKDVVQLDGRQNVRPNDEEALMKAVAHQPVATGIQLTGHGLQFYSEGVYTGDCGTEPNHGVGIVGYGESPEGIKFWTVKNSWGPGWGEKGYIHLQRGVKKEGLCGIAMHSSIPLMNDPKAPKDDPNAPKDPKLRSIQRMQGIRVQGLNTIKIIDFKPLIKKFVHAKESEHNSSCLSAYENHKGLIEIRLLQYQRSKDDRVISSESRTISRSKRTKLFRSCFGDNEHRRENEKTSFNFGVVVVCARRK